MFKADSPEIRRSLPVPVYIFDDSDQKVEVTSGIPCVTSSGTPGVTSSGTLGVSSSGTPGVTSSFKNLVNFPKGPFRGPGPNGGRSNRDGCYATGWF